MQSFHRKLLLQFTESNNESIEFLPLSSVFDVEKVAISCAAQFVGTPIVELLGQARYLRISNSNLEVNSIIE